LGLLAAVAMLFTGLVAPVTAMAADTYTLTIEQADQNHTYEAYQVFSGKLSTDNKTLTNIQWGSGVNGGAILTALQGDTTFGEGDSNVFKGVTTAAGVAEKLAKYKDDSTEAKAFAKVVANNLTSTKSGEFKAGTPDKDGKVTYTNTGLAAGYYLIKDKDNSLTGATAYTDYILKITNDVNAKPKGEAPTVQKKVKDTNDSTGDTSDWQDSADHDINDKVDYQLTGTLPSNYDSYTTYTYKFTDILSAGLTYDANSAKVYVVNGEQRVEVTNQFTVTGPTEYTPTDETKEAAYMPITKGQETKKSHSLTFAPTSDDLKKITGATIDKDSKIVIEYTATLNDFAKVGSAGNPNKVDLTYSNNPNGTGEGTLPPDEVIVFTFKLTVNKTDGTNPLTGAAFSLYKYDHKTSSYGTTPVKQYTQQDALSSFDFSGLDDGQYKLVEDEAPDTTYNKIDPIEFKIVATHTQDDGNPARTLTALNIQDLNGNNLNDFTIDVSSKDVSTDVVNKKGSELPKTGGMGTVILYALGGAFVVAAGLWFGLRRRFSRR
ncbi:isopeptide-forming domain-containing fimbrial protein, partial [Bifidobacterium biavatii]